MQDKKPNCRFQKKVCAVTKTLTVLVVARVATFIEPTDLKKLDLF
jgi:hypothetical protein